MRAQRACESTWRQGLACRGCKNKKLPLTSHLPPAQASCMGGKPRGKGFAPGLVGQWYIHGHNATGTQKGVQVVVELGAQLVAAALAVAPVVAELHVPVLCAGHLLQGCSNHLAPLRLPPCPNQQWHDAGAHLQALQDLVADGTAAHCAHLQAQVGVFHQFSMEPVPPLSHGAQNQEGIDWAAHRLALDVPALLCCGRHVPLAIDGLFARGAVDGGSYILRRRMSASPALAGSDTPACSPG